ncbi:hypothetical protein PLICRDRAFT_180029 [Plicaturopsis crispa FD-325 SS-3]|uniref:Uncharacterized protein n=1 Tax=Plicaturopsis crispa FD-325 SS-3 TaxID=944288 RepID=A0A0C9SQR9_PLICR|nr:hypothetical protein PLICRDRAFT_180029 [Plicaturopsis crispa FD-325 SS-3]
MDDTDDLDYSQHNVDASFTQPDPFAPHSTRRGASFFNALLATALFRCWHILLFFTAWATAITLINERVRPLTIQITLLTVVGTVLGFVISYRTTSSFERYNEGRRLWSQIILGSRNFARLVWFHVPDNLPSSAINASMPEDERRARVLIEKKTIVNLLEAFGVAVKHYLRGEDSIYYTDLYHLVKFLPAYALPAGIPSTGDLSQPPSPDTARPSGMSSIPEIARNTEAARQRMRSTSSVASPTQVHFRPTVTSSEPNLPLPATSPSNTKKGSTQHNGGQFLQAPPIGRRSTNEKDKERMSVMSEEGFLLPARMPPKYHIFDLFPFSLFVRALTKRGHDVKGRKAARMRAKLRGKSTTHNLPLELSLYLSSYLAALQNRKVVDAPTANALIASLNSLVDALTGLERILTTPIPFSYAIHLWVVTIIYCLLLPFQIYATFKWLTIPATAILSFIFFGFLVAGEEIENPFGYDKNDLNMDHFTANIIRKELRAITASTAPDPTHWVFVPSNDLVFAGEGKGEERVAPEEWVARGTMRMQAALSEI